MDLRTIEMMLRYVDCLQVGARNMQNFDLLKDLGKVRRPVLLKRGLSATIEELLLSAEYILAGGNQQVILCERGIRTFENATRNTLDISAIPVVKKLSHLPIVVDPSHGTGIASLVPAMAAASVAAGADGNRRAERGHAAYANLFIRYAVHRKRLPVEPVHVADTGVVGHEVQAVTVAAPLRVDALARHRSDERCDLTRGPGDRADRVSAKCELFGG
jgi:hypothetical protein